jgi:hypothetical protein
MNTLFFLAGKTDTVSGKFWTFFYSSRPLQTDSSLSMTTITALSVFIMLHFSGLGASAILDFSLISMVIGNVAATLEY